MGHVRANTVNSVFGIAAAVFTFGALLPSARAVTVTSSDSGVVFQDTFANDTPGALPTVVSPDVGSGYTQLEGTTPGTVDIETDPAGVLGQVLNLANDASTQGALELNFAPQSGSMMEARFRAKVTDPPGGGGSVGAGFRSGGTYVCGQHIYLVTGQWPSTPLPPGITDDDVVLVYYTGSYQFATVGGDPAAARVDGGAGRWIDVTLTQQAAGGSYPVFTLNGTVLDPVPLGSSASSFDGLALSHNGSHHAQSYVGAAAPEPTFSELTVTSSTGGLVFRETFGDVLGAQPTIGSGDLGSGYTPIWGHTRGLTEIENDVTATGALNESFPGKYLNIANDAVEYGLMNLGFPSQPEGSVLTASFRVNITHAGNGGSLGAGFTSGLTLDRNLEFQDYLSSHHIYLVTGQWLGSLPPGITDDDVVLVYYTGSYQLATAGGDPAAARVDGGAGKWIDVRLTQTAAAGSQPVFTLNGTVLDPVPLGSTKTSIDGLRLRHNGAAVESYVSGETTPAPPAPQGTVMLVRSLPSPEQPIAIGSRLELFVDRYLVDGLSGDAELRVQEPVPQEVSLVTDEPWEGNTCAFYTIFEDGGIFRMYYRGSHYDWETGQQGHPQVACYAESSDGIVWTRPELGIIEFDGSTSNNIVWDGVGSHNFTPFKDANPGCPPESRYKAFGKGTGGLYAFQSADAIHWELMQAGPLITAGDFDSQNLAFWDPHANLYREYHRKRRNGVRDIMTGTSPDFLNWTYPVFLEYPDAPVEHLYTSAVQSYGRAPHILIGFPTRFLPDTSQVEPTFMASRDGYVFHRWTEAVIPLTAPQDRDGNRSNYMTWGLVKLPGADTEYSVYATEAYYAGPDSRVRRFVYRVDGFVSLHASPGVGELQTKPLLFEGDELVINMLTAPNGNVRVEIQDYEGVPIDDFTLADCDPVQGDAIERVVTWAGSPDPGQLAGRPVRLRFVLENADVYSFRFR